jgi:small subunit ribosomal protein S1
MTISTVAKTAPQVAINDIGSEEDLLAAIDATIKHFNDGDIVEGVIVKVDRDEVLLDIGYKTEGVIPSRELSIKHDVDPATRSSRSATRSRPSSSRRRTRKVA